MRSTEPFRIGRPTSPPHCRAGVAGLRIGLDTSHLGGAPCESEVRETVANAARTFAELGAQVEEVGVRTGGSTPWSRTRFWTCFASGDTGAGASSFTTRRRRRCSPTTSHRDLERGRRAQATDYLTCINKIGRYRAHAARFFASHDLLLTPTTATTAFAVGDYPRTVGGKPVAHPRFGFTPFTYLFNLTGNPAASVPCGFDSEGMPVGLQIVADMQDEMAVLAASAAFESARPWAATRPALARRELAEE